VNGVLHVSGLTPGQSWHVYNLTGTLIYTGVADAGANISTSLNDRISTSLNDRICVCPLPVRGVYIVRSGNNVVKVVY
jgi:hypothetical protein